ncbi:MAG: hypothetical protein WD768_15110 [Phycisphaeraceae bacterium]
MPVPTETLRSIRKLNIVFAGSALFLLAVTAWLIMDDYIRPWRQYQRDGLDWQAAITVDQRSQLETDAFRKELAEKEERIRLLQEALPKNQIAQLQQKRAEQEVVRNKEDLPLAIAKSNIVPLEQQLERVVLEYGEIDPATGKVPAPVAKLQTRLQNARADYEQKQAAMNVITASIAGIDAQIASEQKAVADHQKEMDNLAREVLALEARLKQVQPTGLAAVGQKLRNAPLLDWLNPSEKIEQVIVPGVRTDLNFLTVETADACQTCHVNIDKPAFQEHELSRFLQRQIARGQRHEVDLIDEAVVSIDFWESAVIKLAVSSKIAQVKLDLLKAQKAALARLNVRRKESGNTDLVPLLLDVVGQSGNDKGKSVETWSAQEHAQVQEALTKELDRVALAAGEGSVTRKQWYEQRHFYMEDLQAIVKKHAGEEENKLISSMFVNTLIGQFNQQLDKINQRLRADGQKDLGFAAVSTNPVLRAHPRLDMYVDPESHHPLNNPSKFIMGCSVCHEGSGQETDFSHVGHVPREAWVDMETGAKVADFLLTGEKGSASQLRTKIRDNKAAKPSLALLKDEKSTGAAGTASASASDHAGHDHADGEHHGPTTISQSDVNLLSPGKPAPFAPLQEIHVQGAIYLDPAKRELRVAVRQAEYWEKAYHWHHTHYHDWEKPMHSMEYVQSSCTKCHTDHYDLRDEGKKVFEGRLLFAQMGCANCHLVDQIQPHKDLKKVGPSLVHVKEKLSPEMMATWIWSPKAFRPTTRMPHFFMLENNSSPLDILRTRTEVAAMTQYLLDAPPSDTLKMAKLMQEGVKQAEIANSKELPGAAKAAAANRVMEINREIDALKAAGLTNYRPELAPSVAVKKHTADIEDFKKKLADAATKEEDKAGIQTKLADAEKQLAAAAKLPQAGDAKRGRDLFLGTGGVMPVNPPPNKPVTIDAGIGCVACHANLNETGERWIVADLVKVNFARSPLPFFTDDLVKANRNLDGDTAARIAAKLVTDFRVTSLTVLSDEQIQQAKVAAGGSLVKAIQDLAKQVPAVGEPDPDPSKEPARLKSETETRTNRARAAIEQFIAGECQTLIGAAYHRQLSYAQQHTYIKQYLPHKLDLRGPELSGVGSKLKAGRSNDEALTWVYDWVRNPRHYSSYTIMPDFRLSEQEALDIAAYLLAQERPGTAGPGSTYEPVDFIGEVSKKEEGKTNPSAAMLDAIVKKLGGDITQSTEAKLNFAGKKLVTHYNCQACHLINGYEDTASSAPQLNDWGLKDPHKLDFGYYEGAEKSRRQIPAHVWKAANEGLSADAAHLTATITEGGKTVVNPKLTERALTWEHIHEDRRAWLTQKLHNTRVFDRGKYVINEALAALEPAALPTGEVVENLRRGIDKSYDKLKMPKFFLTDEQAQSIITFVTSIRKPLVDTALQKVADDLGRKATIGRQIAEKYNCIACHNIDGNDVAIQQYFGVLDEQGRFNNESQRLQSAPPRLIGQGAKTQPDWIVHFLQNVHELRPWLSVRMPSFHFAEGDPNGIAEYFAGATHHDDKTIEAILSPIQAQMQKNEKRRGDLTQEAEAIKDRVKIHAAILDTKDEKKKLNEQYLKSLSPDQAMLLKASQDGKLDVKEAQRLAEFSKYADARLAQIQTQIADLDRWWTQSAVARSTEKLQAFGFRNHLAQARAFDRRVTLEAQRGAAWNGLFAGAQFLSDTYEVTYPFPEPRLPKISEERFLRGEALFINLKCSACHLLGDEDKLFAIWKKEVGAGAAPAAPAEDDDPFGVGAVPEEVVTGPASKAPNLRYAVHRLQARWIDRWLQRSLIILPGTTMPNQWGDDSLPIDSAFGKYPDEAKADLHKKFYYTGPEQRQLIIDYLYAVSLRNATPGEWKLTGAPEPKYDELPPVAPPKPDEFELPKVASAAGTGTGPAVVEVGSSEEKAVSDIVLHEGSAPYEGDAVNGNKTRVVGVVKFDGKAPRRGVINMASDPVCAKAHEERQQSDGLVVSEALTVRYTLVHVKSSVPGTFQAPAEGKLIDQVGCIYKPHVQAVMTGQTLRVKNSDSTSHNVHIIPDTANTGNPEMNIGQNAKGIYNDLKFARPEVGIFMKCDVHSWMNARIHVFTHPFFAVSDVEGRFEIKGLPPGKHTLEFVHENPRIAAVTVEVEVKADSSTRVDASLNLQ